MASSEPRSSRWPPAQHLVDTRAEAGLGSGHPARQTRRHFERGANAHRGSAHFVARCVQNGVNAVGGAFDGQPGRDAVFAMACRSSSAVCNRPVRRGTSSAST
jgi:hypothetical protein